MKVALDAGPLSGGHSVRGLGFYTRYLAESLQKITDIDLISFDKNPKKLKEYDLIHYPDFVVFNKALPKKFPTKAVVTVHDVTPLIYPKQYRSGLKGRKKLASQIKSLKKAAGIITDTESSKKDIVRFLKIPQENIHPIHLAPASHFRKLKNENWKLKIRKKFSLPKIFVLYVGDINYNKNIPNLIKATKLAKLPLVIVGKQANELDDLSKKIKSLSGPRDYLRFLLGRPHPELAHYKNITKALKKNKKVIRTGFVTDEELVMIYNLATVYCQPSLYEGFGLPVLEALACGTPVVANKTQALVEIAENSATFTDATNPKELAKALKQKHQKPDPTLIKKYSWAKTAKHTLDVYKKII